MSSGDESDAEPISTDMLEYIYELRQSHPRINRIEARYKIRDRMNQRQPEWKGALKATQRMSKVLHNVFKTFLKRF